MLLLNPRRRKRKSKSARRRHRRGARRMTAKQLKYFGPRKARRHSKRRARRRTITIQANPISRRSRRRVRRSASRARRRYRRNPISASLGGLRASLSSVQRVATNAAVGGAGAVATDLAYGALLRFMPDTLAQKIASRYGADGGVNFMYYAAKMGLAVGLGVAGSQFLPPKLRGYAAKGAEGALTVGAYEIMRLSMPVALSSRMGWYSTGRVAAGGSGIAQNRLSAYVGSRRLSGMGSSLPAGSAFSGPVNRADVRVGEGSIS